MGEKEGVEEIRSTKEQWKEKKEERGKVAKGSQHVYSYSLQLLSTDLLASSAQGMSTNPQRHTETKSMLG
jgi:hypothetical protein